MNVVTYFINKLLNKTSVDAVTQHIPNTECDIYDFDLDLESNEDQTRYDKMRHSVHEQPTMPEGNDSTLSSIIRENGSRADNMAARYNIRLQRRTEENMIYQTNRNRTIGKIYKKELDDQENRVWFETDAMSHPIKQLK